ncbi:hypothetical protein NAEGRDRAFT_58416 [Naegleria gruberi]|uniref:Microbial-type PARG catalytic domain-containing protein n=1 Tax=Naegleria gruberi TaxID=5762 RepID=D2VJS4_NAEGR|nr:uncharacterized protein NAEGRDRAFT_58416 [Naegleria gruberi]EFC43083.1 hypothetical protein NAEGRDRAFT_58416 [Naegleria gruberi]|eukprot:XP_002675827.1 hypothetical protein NAEGRDRAFT_58416 [Naegleria gruberi strain NEG-M]
MINSTLPKLRNDYPAEFPSGLKQFKTIIHQQESDQENNKIKTIINEKLYLKLVEDQTCLNWLNDIQPCESSLSVEEILKKYREAFHRIGSRSFDLHGEEFQNFCLRVTNRMSRENVRKLSYSKSHADKRLLRGRVYAIGSRVDVAWDGTMNLSEEQVEEKRSQLIDHLSSLTLYDWFCPELKPEAPLLIDELLDSNLLKTRSLRMGTQEVVELVSKELNDSSKKVAWVNFANAHNVCGTYCVDYGGSQEEEVATNCDGAALLGTVGKLIDTGMKSFVRGRWVSYKKGLHLPPGGNYFTKTKFVTGSEPVDCYMIAAAFADFRPFVPFFTPYSERNYFYSWYGYGNITNEKELEQRLILDIEGVLKTCADQNIHTLVTGASGCGAFLHDPFREAKLWRKCLKKYENSCLKQVIFAVFDLEESPNWAAFSEAFNQ